YCARATRAAHGTAQPGQPGHADSIGRRQSRRSWSVGACTIAPSPERPRMPPLLAASRRLVSARGYLDLRRSALCWVVLRPPGRWFADRWSARSLICMTAQLCWLCRATRGARREEECIGLARLPAANELRAVLPARVFVIRMRRRQKTGA